MPPKEKKETTALAVKDAAQILVGKIMPSVAEVLPNHIDKKLWERVLLSTIRNNPKLEECSLVSLGNALMKAGRLGLEPGSALQECYLVPFKDECTLVIGYAGRVKLMVNSGGITGAPTALAVRANDEFDYNLGTGAYIRHRPLLKGEAERGAIIAFYCVGRLPNGDEKFEIMTVEQVNAVRDRSRGYQAAVKYGKSHPWDTDYEAMGCKTVLNRLSKYIPKAANNEAARALALAEELERADYGDPQERRGGGKGRPLRPTLRGALNVVEGSAEVVPDDAGGDGDDAPEDAAPAPPDKPSAPPAAPNCGIHEKPLVMVSKANGDAVFVCQTKGCKFEATV